MDSIRDSSTEDETKTIDIYQHMKINLNNPTPNCECGEIPTLYCIPCKVSVCQNCTYDSHKNHLLIEKDKQCLNEDEVDKLFKKTERSFNNSELFHNAPKLKQQLKDEVKKMCDVLHEKVDKMKKNKMEEIYSNLTQYLCLVLAQTMEEYEVIRFQ